MQAVGIGEGVKEEKVLETSVGETLTIRLWEDRPRGEIYVPSYDPEALALLNDEYERSFGDSNNAIDSGKRAFEFRALKPGVHRIVFEKRMGWKFTPEDRRVFTLTGGGGKAGAARDPGGPDIAFFNDVFLPPSPAPLSVEDTGFLFWDGGFQLTFGFSR